jgi:hypothetical protein
MLSKLQNVTVKVVGTMSPRATSFKAHLWRWCVQKQEFTKQEFLDACLELKEQLGVTSKMKDEVMSKAWYNEFHGKEKVLQVVE